MKTIITTIAAAALMTTINPVNAGNFQHDALFNPGQLQLQAEAGGRVMIYDRLDNETVELALNDQFDRIENMMFVRTRHVQPSGIVEEDEDCD